MSSSKIELVLVGAALSLLLPTSASAQSTTAAASPSAADPTVLTIASKGERARDAKNAIYLDLLGPGGLYSVNYDRFFTDDISGRIGLSYFSMSASAGVGDSSASSSTSLLMVPLTLSWTGVHSADRTHNFELGAGPVIANVNGSGSVTGGGATSGSGVGVAGTVLVGYRLQPADGGFVFRVGASPLFGQGGFLPWGYVSLGYGF